MRVALAAAILVCFGLPAFCASSNPAPAGLTVQRSTRVFPHRFNVHPDGATVAANQTQRFEVTDAQGKTVAVHWNVSGLGCSGLACGTIDDQGVYHTPSTLPRPGVIILEAVLDSNPNYSVLTQIALVPAAKTGRSPAVIASPAQVAAAAPQPEPHPEAQKIPSLAEQQNLARNNALPPLPNAVAAAPVVERQAAAGRAPALQPNVTRPLPVIEGNNVAPEHSSSLLPLPNAVAAAPALERQIVARVAPSTPPPTITRPLPVIERSNVVPERSSSLLPLPNAVAAAPVAERQLIAHASAPPPLLNATAPLPAAENKSVTPRHSAPSLSNAPAAGPSAKTQTIDLDSVAPPASVSVRVPMPAIAAKTASSGHLPQPNPAVTAAPVVDTQIVARAFTPPPPLSNVAASTAIATSRPLPLPSPVTAAPSVAPSVERETVARNTPPLSPTILPVPVATIARPISGSISNGSISDGVSDGPVSKTLGTTAAVAGTIVASRATLLPLPEEAAASLAVKTPPDAPIVTYRDGQLTIDAKNSTLAEVLRLVAEKSGAKIEVPPGSGLERIYEHAGPGPAQDVLVRLLNGSVYDFIIVSSPQTPNAPAQVLLSLRGAEPPANAAVASNQISQVMSPAVEPKAAGGNPYLWTPPTSAPLFSNGADQVVPHQPAVAPPDKPIPPDVLEQMLKDYGKQLRGGPPPQ